jgi:hypothetical protein
MSMSAEPDADVHGAEAPVVASPGPAPPKRHRLLFWTAMVLALAAVGGGLGLAYDAYEEETAPERVVLDYFAAVAGGDAAAALAYGDLPDEESDLLTAEVLAAQLAIAPITAVTVHVPAASGKSASAQVSYQLEFPTGAQTVEDTIPLTRAGRTWRLATVAVPVAMRVTNGTSRATLAGADVPFGRHLLFPGALPIAFDTASLGLEEDTRVVRFAQVGDLEESAELTEAGMAAVAAALDAAFEACLAGTADAPTLCPLPADARAVPGSLSGTTASPASGEILIETQAGNDGLVRMVGDVTVTGEYQTLDFNNQHVVKTGDLVVEVRAACYVTSPESIIWRTA